jgi:hypothetical protein
MLALAPLAQAQEFDFQPPRSASDPEVGTEIRDLASRILPVLEDADRERFLANLSALQLVGGDYQAADDTRKSLRDRRGDDARTTDGRALLIDLYAQARAIEANDGVPFTEAFGKSFRDLVPQLSDRDAHGVTAWVGTPLTSFEDTLQKALDRIRDRESLEQAEAIHLVWAYLAFDAYRSFGELLGTLGAEDDRRRYAIEEDVAVPGTGARVRARMVRPKDATKLPALLHFTIFDAANDAKAAAAHGYAGIVARTRTKIPFDHDGEDARAVMRWIARQPWSDGRVGMYGGTYGAFAAWAAARGAPRELKAIATLDAMAPGIDFPSEGRIFRNAAYRWAQANTVSSKDVRDDAAWRELDQAWFRSGKSYRELDRIAKKRSAVFQGWLGHPSYDRYWQKLIPYRWRFPGAGVPVLAMAGYAGSAELGTLHYFAQHDQYRKDADHTLLLGAHDDSTMLDGPSARLQGPPVDPLAYQDLREMRFEWFDHVLKGAAKPALLRDRVNYTVMGANEWHHAPSLAGMANGALKLHLDTGGGDPHRLVATKPATAPLEQVVSFADRGDAAWQPQTDIVSRSIQLPHGSSYVSDPVEEATDVVGVLSGELDFKINKADVDLYVALYEQQPDGDYLQLFDPYEFRASYTRDRSQRKLLRAGKRQQLEFRSEQMMSRRLQAGSRLVLVVGVNKRADREVNHGSGKAVAEETVADGKVPLKLEWFPESYVEVPVRRSNSGQGAPS